MRSDTIKSSEWHRRPEGSTGHCPFCGYPQRNLFLHRLQSRSDDGTRTWAYKVRSERGWITFRLTRKPKPRRAHLQTAPSPEVAERLGKMAALIAYGKSIEAAAKSLGISEPLFRYYRKRWADVWQMLVDQAAEQVQVAVRAMAGTAKILDDPDAHLLQAQFVDKWSREKGVDLFAPPDGQNHVVPLFRGVVSTTPPGRRPPQHGVDLSHHGEALAFADGRPPRQPDYL